MYQNKLHYPQQQCWQLPAQVFTASIRCTHLTKLLKRGLQISAPQNCKSSEPAKLARAHTHKCDALKVARSMPLAYPSACHAGAFPPRRTGPHVHRISYFSAPCHRVQLCGADRTCSASCARTSSHAWTCSGARHLTLLLRTKLMLRNGGTVHFDLRPVRPIIPCAVSLPALVDVQQLASVLMCRRASCQLRRTQDVNWC